MINIFLRVPPIPASRPRTNFRTGAIYNTSKYRTYMQELQRAFISAIGSVKPLKGDLIVDMTFYMPMPKKRVRDRPGIKPDLSNLIKACEDAANKILWHDDCQIVELKARKVYDWKNSKIGIEMIISDCLIDQS